MILGQLRMGARQAKNAPLGMGILLLKTGVILKSGKCRISKSSGVRMAPRMAPVRANDIFLEDTKHNIFGISFNLQEVSL